MLLVFTNARAHTHTHTQLKLKHAPHCSENKYSQHSCNIKQCVATRHLKSLPIYNFHIYSNKLQEPSYSKNQVYSAINDTPVNIYHLQNTTVQLKNTSRKTMSAYKTVLKRFSSSKKVPSTLGF